MIMKKLLYLFFAINIISCGGDDDSNETNEPQSFFEKYDGVVWEKIHPFDYISRIQINNGNSISVNAYFQEQDYTDCSTEPLEDDSELIEVNENSFVLFIEDFEGDMDVSYTVTVTAIEEGSKLTIVDSDFPNDPDVYNRTTLNQPCD